MPTEEAFLLVDVIILVFVYLKLCLGIGTTKFGMVTKYRWPWIGFNDISKEGSFQWSDGNAGDVYT